MNDPMVGAMLKLTHQIGDYRGAQGDNIAKTWGDIYRLLFRAGHRPRRSGVPRLDP